MLVMPSMLIQVCSAEFEATRGRGQAAYTWVEMEEENEEGKMIEGLWRRKGITEDEGEKGRCRKGSGMGKKNYKMRRR